MSAKYQSQISSASEESYSEETVSRSYHFNPGNRTGLYVVTINVYNKYEELIYS